ncbi:MAG: GIY-YIG nuclease family protein [Candidatus Yanofskybacteria bacterium]|nr:GIY-YIG nuclease family protein [Candidatus Yanofskybacteria bacterium]
MSFVYIIKNYTGKLYIGITENLKQRLYYHNTKQGAQFTKTKSKFYIALSEEYRTLTEARKREIQIKKWRRDKKNMLMERFQKGLPTKREL